MSDRYSEEMAANRPAMVFQDPEQPHTLLSRLQQHRLYLKTELEKADRVIARIQESPESAEIINEVFQISGLFHD